MPKKSSFFYSKRFWKRILLLSFFIPLLLLGVLYILFHFTQDAIVQSQLEELNKGHKGFISIGDTHLAPFKSFPYTSVKIDDVKVLEDKDDSTSMILDVEDIYIGFSILDMLKGNYDIQSLVIENGIFNFVFHEDGSNNLTNAFATADTTSGSETTHIHLSKIKLVNLDVHKYDEATKVDVETYIKNAKGGFKTDEGFISSHVDANFVLNIIDDGDTTYINHKHFELDMDVTFDEQSGVVAFKPSEIIMEHGEFNLYGTLDTKNDLTLDMKIVGANPNFDLFIAFAPEDVIPVLERYRNAGKIYFNAEVNGPTLHGQMPFIDVKFGASEAYLENTAKNKRIDNMGFVGHFTNGSEKTMEAMNFSLTDMTATLEQGNFVGSVMVKNFVEPEIEMQVNTDFNLEFIAGFLDLKDLEDVAGEVALQMNFHDIIDLEHPEKALSELNTAYFSELRVDNLHLTTSNLPVPIDQLDIYILMNGKKAEVNKFNLKMGNSDLSMNGFVSDLPAIVHHTNIPVDAHLNITSKLLDVAELSQYSKADTSGIDEQIEDLKLALSFKSSARAFTESIHLPSGEFFVDDLHAQLKHYPHELHDFHVDVLIDSVDLKIKDFTGNIDSSDFHINGLIHDYAFWMKDKMNGDVDLDLSLTSEILKLEDLFTYQGENFVPPDYRHEELDNLALHTTCKMHYVESNLQSIDVDLDQLSAKMHLHPMRLKEFNGRIHYEDDHIVIQKFNGNIGRTNFGVDLDYYLGNNEAIKKRDNHLKLTANYIDFDQLFNFKTEPPHSSASESLLTKSTQDVKEHSEAFNLYELPFTDMTFEVDVGHFIYHRLDLQKIHADFKITHQHKVFVDTLTLNAAGGSFAMSGVLNGSDPKHIFISPNLVLNNVDIDKLFFKFENFGQDELVSENVHGRLDAHITGNIRVYPDLVPDLDQSVVHMDVQLLDGRLDNFEPMQLLSDYLGDKDLNSVRFDTLENHLDITNGLMTIPSLTIESSIGHYEISGKQDLNDNIEYYLRIPWKVVKDGAKYKLTGKKRDGTKEDEIVKKDTNKKNRYVNLKIDGTIDDFKIKMGKDK